MLTFPARDDNTEAWGPDQRFSSNSHVSSFEVHVANGKGAQQQRSMAILLPIARHVEKALVIEAELPQGLVS